MQQASPASAAQESSFDVWQVFHTLIGISIMLFGRYLPAPSILVEATPKLLAMGFTPVDGQILLAITPIGMTVLMLFLGVVYLWSTVDTLWPCFLGTALLGFSDYAPMTQVISQLMGNPTTVLIFFLLIFAAALIRSNVSTYLARWLMTHKMVRGRPWALIFATLIASYLVAFLDQVSAAFLIWPAMYIMFEQAGYKKGDSLVSLMMVNSMIMILLSFASDPVKGGAFYLLSNLYALAASNPELHVVPLNYAAYLFFGLTISMTSLCFLLLSMRFIFRVDVRKLSSFNPDVFNATPLPPMNWQQKATLVLFFCYVVWMLMPGLLGTSNALGKFCTQNVMGGSLIVVFLLTFVQFRGKPVADITVTNAAYPWRVFFLIAVAVLMGNAVLNKVTNVSVFMEYLLGSWLKGLEYTPLIVMVCIIGLVVTNFCNSVVSGIIFTPVLLALCITFNYAPGPLLACFFYITLVAACTPAASPFAAMLFDNKTWVPAADAARYGVFSSLIVLTCMIVLGIPLARLLF